MSPRVFTDRDMHLALDGELPVDERADFEAWLAASPEVAARYSRLAEDGNRLRAALAGVADEPLPPALAKLVAGERSTRSRLPSWRAAAAAAAIFVIGGASGYLLGTGQLGIGASARDHLTGKAIAAHEAFATVDAHAVEVSGKDRDYLVGWLSKRVGLQVVAPDLAAEGFELLGGRVLPTEKGTAAQLLYQDGEGARVSIYMTAEGAAKARGTYDEDGSTRAIYWLDEGYGCAIVGTLPQERLTGVARDAWKQMISGLDAP